MLIRLSIVIEFVFSPKKYSSKSPLVIFKSVSILILITIWENVFQNPGASSSNDGHPVFSSNRQSHQRYFHDLPRYITFSIFLIFLKKQQKNWFFVKGPFWDKLSETTFETASNHSPAKEETVSLLPFEASSLSSPLMTHFFLLQNSSTLLYWPLLLFTTCVP